MQQNQQSGQGQTFNEQTIVRRQVQSMLSPGMDEEDHNSNNYMQNFDRTVAPDNRRMPSPMIPSLSNKPYLRFGPPNI